MQSEVEVEIEVRTDHDGALQVQKPNFGEARDTLSEDGPLAQEMIGLVSQPSWTPPWTIQ